MGRVSCSQRPCPHFNFRFSFGGFWSVQLFYDEYCSCIQCRFSTQTLLLNGWKAWSMRFLDNDSFIWYINIVVNSKRSTDVTIPAHMSLLLLPQLASDWIYGTQRSNAAGADPQAAEQPPEATRWIRTEIQDAYLDDYGNAEWSYLHRSHPDEAAPTDEEIVSRGAWCKAGNCTANWSWCVAGTKAAVCAENAGRLCAKQHCLHRLARSASSNSEPQQLQVQS